MCRVSLLAEGMSTAVNSTPDSIRLAMKATLRARRSSLAITSMARCRRHRARAAASWGRSLRFALDFRELSDQLAGAAAPGDGRPLRIEPEAGLPLTVETR